MTGKGQMSRLCSRRATKSIQKATGWNSSLTSLPMMIMEQILLEFTSKHLMDKKARMDLKRTNSFINLIAFHEEMSVLLDKGRAVHISLP